MPKEDIMSEWTEMHVNNKNDMFWLQYVYELNTLLGQSEQWVKLKYWEIES